MPRLTVKQKNTILSRTEDVLNTLLSFNTAYRAAILLHDDASTRWRDFEERLHIDYPIKGLGVKATRNNLQEVRADIGGFLHSEEDLFPGDVTNEMWLFPYQAASAAYVFTLLEGYGDDIVNLINPGYLGARQAWHHGIYGDANLSEAAQVRKAKEGFAKPFKLSFTKIPKYVVGRLVNLKAIRNEFMHEGHSSVDFPDFLANIIGTVCFIQFTLLPSVNNISVYPYYDYNDKWK